MTRWAARCTWGQPALCQVRNLGHRLVSETPKSPASSPDMWCWQQPVPTAAQGSMGNPLLSSPQGTSWTCCPQFLGRDHKFIIWDKQTASNNGMPLFYPFPVGDVLRKPLIQGVLAEDSLTSPSPSQFKGVHRYLYFHWPHIPLFFRYKRKSIAQA